MPNVKKQKIDLSILFYNCIFTISNTQKEKNKLKKYLKKIGANVYEKFIQYCIKNSIICKKENYIRFSIEYKSSITNNITLIVPLFLKHINYNYLILLKNLLNIFFFEKFKILINDNINYDLKCNAINRCIL